MYEIDFNTCTARDVIQRSMTCHPSLMRDKLHEAAKTHSDYIQTTRCLDNRAIEGATRLRDACHKAMAALALEDIDAIMGDFSATIVAFEVACQLQLVPRHLRPEIIGRA